MIKVLRSELLKMDKVLYIEYKDKELPDSPFRIKFTKSDEDYNDWIQEGFPISEPDDEYSDAQMVDFFSRSDYMEQLPCGIDIPISDNECSREAMYEDIDTEYLVYSKDDIRKLIDKLKGLL